MFGFWKDSGWVGYNKGTCPTLPVEARIPEQQSLSTQPSLDAISGEAAPSSDEGRGLRLSLQRLVVANVGQRWLERLFRQAGEQASASDAERSLVLDPWLDYKHRSARLSPENWLAIYLAGKPVGLAQGASVAKVFHTHFFYIMPEFQTDGVASEALLGLEEAARRRRCHTVSFEGPRTTAIVRAMRGSRLTAGGFAWHERLHLRIELPGRASASGCVGDCSMSALQLSAENVTRLMKLESDAFRQAACDHPGELPADFSDGYRTTLIPMAATSAVALDADRRIRGALYGEPKGDAVWIHALFVEPGWRNRGIAKDLLEHCLEQFALAGYAAAELMVLGANGPAIRIYAQVGFQELRRVDLFIKRVV